MRFAAAALALLFMIVGRNATAVSSAFVAQVQAVLDAKDFTRAENEIRSYRAQHGNTPELINSIAWMARGELREKRYDQADAYALEARKLAIEALKKRPLDQEPQLPLALGASMEVQAQIMAARGQRGEAVAFLRDQLHAYGKTSIANRIQKNINLLSLEGKPAPALDVTHWLGSKPHPLAQLRGHPVLLFFWAHWCGDCKLEVSAIQRINATYGPRSLIVAGPTQHYGYVAEGTDATPERETKYIEEIRLKYYARIGAMPVPLSEANFRSYGASTTPTLVLIDKAGIVRLYNPGSISYEELAAKIERVVSISN